MEINPFAPPTTTDLDSREVPPGTDLHELEPAAAEALASAGRWARWAAVLGGLLALLSLVRLLTNFHVFVQDRIAQVGALTVPVSGLVAWLTWQFARAASRVPLDDGVVEEAARAQRRLFSAYALLALLLMASIVAGVVAGYMLGRASRMS